jgi:hypothetical protein
MRCPLVLLLLLSLTGCYAYDGYYGDHTYPYYGYGNHAYAGDGYLGWAGPGWGWRPPGPPAGPPEGHCHVNRVWPPDRRPTRLRA